MYKKRPLFILTLAGLITAGLLYAFNEPGLTPGTNQSKFILIKSAEMMRSGIFKPNAAILITDLEEIKENEALFIGNRTYGHACGYHYDIQFWESPGKLIEEFSFNQECEEFAKNDRAIQSKMRDYIKILESKPSHYIYNLEISVSIDPDSVEKVFDHSDLNVIFLNGKTTHFSSLTFSYMQVSDLQEYEDRSKWDGEKEANAKLAIDKMNSIITDIKELVAITDQSKISFPMQSFGKTIEHKAEVTLKFNNGTDFTNVREVIISHGGKIEKENNPVHYFVQLVDNSDDLENIKSKLTNFKFVTNIYEYPGTK